MASIQMSQAQGNALITVFRLPERVNLSNFAELEESAKEAYTNGMRDLVIDLSQTVSLTSIGIRAIVVIHKLLATDGKKHLKVAAPMPYLREMLDISGVTQYIEIYNTVDEAVASF
jgi:anti-anti-sigma factor